MGSFGGWVKWAAALGVVGLAAGGPLGAAAADAPAKVTVLEGVGQGAPTVALYWIGKPLGFQKDENIDADVRTVPNGNVAQGVQLVASGQADGALGSIEGVVVPASQGKDTGLVFVYNFYQRPTWRLLVANGSGITSISQLKGKTVGIPTPGNPAEPILRAFLGEAGLGESDVDVQAVGVETPAAEALKNGQIAGLLAVSLSSAMWDVAGFNFVALPEPKEFDYLIGPALAVSRNTLKDPVKREAMVRFLRTWAKSAIFVKTNPAAAIKLDYELFPLAKPRNVSDAAALEQGEKAQADVMQGYTTNVGGKWGAFRPDAFQKYVDFLGLTGKIPDVNALWSNDLIDEINNFDANAVVREAKDFK